MKSAGPAKTPVPEAANSAVKAGRRRHVLIWGVLPSLMLALNQLFFAPLFIYAGNADEFRLPFSTLVVGLWPGLVGVGLVGVVFGLLQPLRTSRQLGAVGYALVVLTWLQGNLLPGHYGVLDGRGMDLAAQAWRMSYELPLWLVLLVLPFVLPRRKLWGFAWAGAIAIASQSVMALTLLPTLPVRDGDISTAPEKAFELSSENNAFFVLLDEFSSEIFLEILEAEPTLAEDLRGFTFFRQNTSVYPTTKASIPAMLTGIAYENEVPIDQYYSSLVGRSLSEVLQRNGYLSHRILLTDLGGRFRGERIDLDYVIPNPYVSKEAYTRHSRASMLDLVFFRNMPFPVKRWFFQQGEWRFRNRWGAGASKPEKYFGAGSVAFFREFLAHMKVADPVPRFKFIHLGIPHPPVFLSAACEPRPVISEQSPEAAQGFVDQARCSLELILRVRARLLQLGLWDSTTFVVAADHGRRKAPADFVATRGELAPEVAGASLALLLIKPALDTEPFRESSAASSVLDLPATIVSLLHVGYEFPGQSAFDSPGPDQRRRRFYAYTWKHRNWQDAFLPEMTQYWIQGESLREDSWQVGRVLEPGGVADNGAQSPP